MIAAFSGRASADGWTLGSDQTKLKGWEIVDVGEVTYHFGHDEKFFPLEWYDFNGRCFHTTALIQPSSGPEAALLLVDSIKAIHVAVLKTIIGNVEVRVLDPEWISCPSSF